MNEIVKKIFSKPFQDIKGEFLKLALEFDTRLPGDVAEKFIYADRVFSYKDVDDFLENAPDDLLQVSKLHELLEMLEQIEKLLNEKDELHRMAVFLGSVTYPPGNTKISFMAKTLKTSLTQTIFRAPRRIDELKEQFETLLAAYISKYMQFHSQLNAKLEDLREKTENIRKQTEIMRRFSEIPQLKKYCTSEMRAEFECNLKNLLPCPYKPTVKELSQHFVCPRCHRSFADEGLISILLKTADESEKLFKRCIDALSYELSQRILAKENDELKSITQAVAVSDLSTITSIMSDELVERIQKALSE